MRAQLSSESLQSKDGKRKKKSSVLNLLLSCSVSESFKFFLPSSDLSNHLRKALQEAFSRTTVSYRWCRTPPWNSNHRIQILSRKKKSSMQCWEILGTHKTQTQTQKKRKKIWEIKMFLFNSMVWESCCSFIDNSYAWCCPSLRAPNPCGRSTSWISFCLVDLILLLLCSRASNLTYLFVFLHTHLHTYTCVYII